MDKNQYQNKLKNQISNKLQIFILNFVPILLQITGIISVSFDHKTSIFSRNILLKWYNIIQAIIISILFTLSWIYRLSTMTTESLQPDMMVNVVVTIISGHIINNIIIYQRIFKNDKLIALLKENLAIYEHKLFYSFDERKIMLFRIFSLVTNVCIIFPIIFFLQNYFILTSISHINTTLKRAVMISMPFFNLWASSAAASFIAFNWMILSIVKTINSRIRKIMLKINKGIVKHQQQSLINDIDEISFFYNKIVELLVKINEFYQEYIVMVLLNSMFNIVWNFFTIVQLLIFRTNTLNMLSFSISNNCINIFYYMAIITTIVMSCDEMVEKCDCISENLHNIQRTLYDGPVLESVSRFVKIN